MLELSVMNEKLKQLLLERYAYRHAIAVLELDGETAAPRQSSEGRGFAMSVLSEKLYGLLESESTRELLEEYKGKEAELDETARRETQLLRQEVEELTRIPKDEYAAYTRLVNDASAKWLSAKEENNYAIFEPYLKQLVEANRRFAAYKNPNIPAYDALLDDFEKGMTMAQIDPLFAMLRSELTPAIQNVSKAPQPDLGSFSIESQRAFAYDLMEIEGLDPTRCTLTESEHPFTQGMNPQDVRITTHYMPEALFSSMYSVIHEGGHALYELNLPGPFYSRISDAPSMGLHESQSRFFENLVGHDPRFLKWLLPRMRQRFAPGLDAISEGDFIRAANYVQPSLIRTEADEVTYPMHVMVRYELEKQLIGGSLSTADLPEKWNAMYREYLGIEVPSDSLGVLQDMHWSNGTFGYFPTYVLGSAYASQFLHAMEQELDVGALLSTGNLSPIRQWLTEHVHRFGQMYLPGQLLEKATGEPFNPGYYVQHLKEVASRQK